MQKPYHIVAVGRACTDVIAHAAAEFLQTHQIPIDGQRECTVTELKEIEAALTKTQLVPGGPSANTVAVISALGGKAGFFGKVFHDGAGESYLADLKQRKIDLCCPPYASTPEMSGICLVLLTGQHRSFAYTPGCGDSFSAADFIEFDFSTSDFFLIEAHLLTSPMAKPAIIAAMEHAQNNCAIVINLQGITQWKGFTDVVQHIISKANIIIGNQDEQAAFAQVVNLQQSSQRVITTKGAAGAEISQAGCMLHHVPAIAPKMFVSSVGSGDAFIAGFLLGQSRGLSLKESMHQGTQTASIILEEEGARPKAPIPEIISVEP
ncbi:MAG: PfkB family carbohydrate kinase [Pseudomonadota bacterium]